MAVYLSEYIHPDAVRLLKERVETVDTLDAVEHIDAIILRNIKVDQELLRRAKRLKVIGKHGVGCNTIDLEAAKEQGVTVLYTPFANTNSVAELIVGLTLAVCRNITRADAGCRADAYTIIAPPDLTGCELAGKTLGLVGMGNIARRAAEILSGGFEMRLLGYDPYVGGEDARAMGIEKHDSLEELIAASDVVNISVPLTPATENLVSGKLFDCFRPGAVLVNAARGGIVNEEDLYEALRSGKLRGAACDAFVEEPPTSKNKLLTLPNFCATPHIGATTEEALYRMGMEVVTEVLGVLEGREPMHRVV